MAGKGIPGMENRARKKNWHPDIVRQRIRVSALLRRLEKFALGEKDDQGLVIVMSPAQVSAALGVVKKAVPDLSAVELSGEVRHRRVEEFTDDELADIAARGSSRAAEEAAGTQEPPSIQ